MTMFVIGAILLAFWNNFMIAVVFSIIGIFIDWRFYRCPHCNFSLDSRMKIIENETYCPHCGEIIK